METMRKLQLLPGGQSNLKQATTAKKMWRVFHQSSLKLSGTRIKHQQNKLKTS